MKSGWFDQQLQIPQKELLTHVSLMCHNSTNSVNCCPHPQALAVPSFQEPGPGHLIMILLRWHASQSTKTLGPSLCVGKKRSCHVYSPAVSLSTSQGSLERLWVETEKKEKKIQQPKLENNCRASQHKGDAFSVSHTFPTRH